MSSSSNYNYFRSWLDKPHLDPQTGLMTVEFSEGLADFMAFASNHSMTKETGKMYCPCSKCGNRRIIPTSTVWNHLNRRGFVPGYKFWYMHGEDAAMFNYEDYSTTYEQPAMEDDVAPQQNVDQMIQMVHDRFQNTSQQYPEQQSGQPQYFYNAMNSANQPLYTGCREGVSALSAATRLMSIKTDYNLSEECVDRIASWGKYLCPEDNTVPKSYYEVHKLVSGLGLPYETFDVCKNNCMIFWHEDSNQVNCLFCGEERYEITGANTRVARKKMWYLPITERLKRLYQSKNTASSMRWHAEHHTDGEIKHPSDAKAWKHFQAIHPEFALEPRNVYLGLSTDGFNPFGRHGRQYSLWPVIVTPYNLPPLLCMKKEFLFLTILVPGPNHPKRALDIFLQPLIQELQMLWENGVEVYDVSNSQQFRMRVVLMWTISDFPAYGMLSGWTTHGRLSCPYCQEETKAFQLKHGRKSCWFDCHRCFLPQNHPYRKSTTLFTKNRKDFDPPPVRASGYQQLTQLRDYGAEETVSCGGSGHTTTDGYGTYHNWHKKSIFWKLPYWKEHLLRHNLDVMHVEKNVFDNIMNTVLNVSGKTKDNVNARKDLANICSRKNLHLLHTGKGPVPAFRLSKQGKDAFFSWIIKHVKFPDGYASNLANCVDHDEEKFVGMKSHDCHVFMQRLLPFVFSDLLPSNVHGAIAAVGAFFRDLCSRSFTPQGMQSLQEKIPLILCNLEKIFPPAFFDVMEHLPIHLPEEAQLGGPVQYRWMYPFERFMFDLKKKVKNLNRVEGSIVQQSLNEETSNLAEYYFPSDVVTKKRRPSRHDDGGEKPSYWAEVPDIFSEVGRLSDKSRNRSLSQQEHNHLHAYIVNNCDQILPFQRTYKDQVMEQYPTYTEEMVSALQDKEFTDWLKYYVGLCSSHGQQLPLWLLDIVHGPMNVVKCFPKYCTRGYAFRVLSRDKSRTTSDAGVSSKSGDIIYYGRLREILEVTYPGGLGLRCVVFNCDWNDPWTGVKIDEFGVTSVHSGKFITKFDPFIIASQADQVCYLPYPSARTNRQTPWVTVTSISPRGTIIGNEDPNPLQENVVGHFNVAADLNVDLILEREDDVLDVSDNEDEEFGNDTDSISSVGDEDSE